MGNPRNKGGPGRPPDEFYNWLAGVVNDPNVRRQYEALMRSPPSPDLFLKALRWGDERLHGKPNQVLESGEGKPLLIVGMP